MFYCLNSGALGIVMTVGEVGYPTDAFSWDAATDKKRVRFGVDQGSKTIDNLNRADVPHFRLSGRTYGFLD